MLIFLAGHLYYFYCVILIIDFLCVYASRFMNFIDVAKLPIF
jgi:hypothetical protein